MKTALILASVIALASCSKADVQASISNKLHEYGIPGVDYNTKSNPLLVDTTVSPKEFMCLDGYLYFFGIRNVTPYISTNKKTGTGEFTKCGHATTVIQADSK
jgi:hypothetical protein